MKLRPPSLPQVRDRYAGAPGALVFRNAVRLFASGDARRCGGVTKAHFGQLLRVEFDLDLPPNLLDAALWAPFARGDGAAARLDIPRFVRAMLSSDWEVRPSRPETRARARAAPLPRTRAAE